MLCYIKRLIMNRNLLQIRRLLNLKQTNRNFATQAELNENNPIKFTSSPASKKAVVQPIVRRTQDNTPWYQMYSIAGSLTVFLLYFCVFREESNIDLEFNKTLYQRIQGLEKKQLLQVYKHNKESGLSTMAIEQRLQELEKEEAQVLTES